MEKFIEVHDNILSPYLTDYIEKTITDEGKGKGMPFVFMKGLTTGKEENFNDFGWSHLLYSPYIYTSEYSTNLNQILYHLGIYKNLNISQITESRVFFQTPSLSPGSQSPHRDSTTPHLVCLYYVNDSDGDTIFFDDFGKEIKRVSPKKGRIAFFDGSIEHSGSRPTKNHRIVINFNFTTIPIK